MPAKGLRAAAKAAGKKTYFTGAPCTKGHVAARYVAGGSCIECMRTRLKSPAKPPDPEARAQTLARWNASTKGYAAKMRWKARDPKNAWACSAVGGAKARAAKAGVAFDLDKEYVRSIAPDTCPVLGLPFVWYGESLRPNSPSLDRLVPEKGYVRGNVAVISMRANAIKSDASVEEIEKVAAWLKGVRL